MDYKVENAIEITWIIMEHLHKNHFLCISFPYTELKDFIGILVENFESIHPDSDWNELDYNDEIIKFTNFEIAKELWKRFSEVPMDIKTKKIDKDWNGFQAGTRREEIWLWFEKAFNVSVVSLMEA